jgi:hypothetical protein
VLFSLIVSGMECALMTLEATNVVAMRVQMIAKGDLAGQREAELMVSEKIEAFAQAGTDILAGVSNAVVLNNFRAVIQANELRLSALRLAA